MYSPSADEWFRFERLRRQVVPDADKWAKYVGAVKTWLECPFAGSRQLDTGLHILDISRVTMRESSLYRREYPVIEVDSSAYVSAFPDQDAVAVDTRSIASGDSQPPFVLLPQVSLDTIGPEIESIVEHECVHVNQMIIGYHPSVRVNSSPESMVSCFLATIRCEYEANLLQLTKWPSLFPIENKGRTGHMAS